jgi:hypothetical protein
VIGGFWSVHGSTPCRATLPSLPMHATTRVNVDAADPHAEEQGSNSGTDQLYVTHASVATHSNEVAGCVPLQLASLGATLPSLPIHFTTRLDIDAPVPHAEGQDSNSGADQLNDSTPAASTGSSSDSCTSGIC